MDLDLINNTIEELEYSDTTFMNCQNLAALYIVRNMYKPNTMSQLDQSDRVIKELSDLFPQYKKYREIKEQYQLNNVDAERVCHAMKGFCNELYEFLTILYSDSDLPDERVYLTEMIEKTQKQYEKIAEL